MASPLRAYALVSGNLVSFNLATPGVPLSNIPITGLIAGQTLVGIDFRATDGQLYTLGVNAATDTASLYTLALQTGVATLVGSLTGLGGDLPAGGYGFDFNPAVDRIRVTTQIGGTTGGLNFRINPDSLAVVNDTQIHGSATGVSGAAYTFASSTTLFALDAVSNSLMLQGGIGGTPSPNGGVETLIGALGINFTDVNGFDIAPGASATGFGFALLTEGAFTGLYSVNLATGATTLIGPFLGGTNTASGFAIDFIHTDVSKNDFNGDGMSDILWRHESGGLLSWELNGGTIIETHFLGSVDNSYRVDEIADFDGNGTADILWRHDSGFVITWDINHTQTGYHAIGSTNPADEIVGTGDFNGDGKFELLWRNADTGVVSWQLNTGPFIDTDLNGDEIAFTRSYLPVTSDWTMVGTGDVNGDGNSDIFWRHDSGQLVSWEVDDGAIIGYNDYGHVPLDYEFIDTGDFNGDGKSGDVLWRHVSGQVVTWELDGGTLIGYHDFGIVTSDYKIEETGDYNGDGMSDILWRHDSGLPIIWELDSGAIIGYHALPTVDPAWQVQP
jgi:Domain of unknown function (DUF4394)/FG-GAP-like repeat